MTSLKADTSGKDNRIKLFDLGVSVIPVMLLFLILGVFFDYYYELNDDVLIKDIISGIYTGTPSGYNNQMMYPLSLIFALLYRCIPAVPWFGLAELGALILAYSTIIHSLIRNGKSRIIKMIVSLFMILLISGLYMWETVIPQYSAVSGILVMAAAVRFLATGLETDTTVSSFHKQNILTVVLMILAYNLRSEMALLFLPLVAGVGLFVWMGEESPFDDTALGKYLGLIGLILAGIVLTFALDRLAYSGEEWKEFRAFFDARTEVYDFTGIPPYEENEEFYNNAGIDRDTYEALTSYDYDLDRDVTTESLNAIAEYVNSGKSIGNRQPLTIKASVKEYIKGMLKFTLPAQLSEGEILYPEVGQLSPMNVLIPVLYIAVIVMLLLYKEYVYIPAVLLMFIFRSVSWIFIYSKQRLMTRITHPLQFFEVVLLLSILLLKSKRRERNIVLAVVAVIALCFIPSQAIRISSAEDNREVHNVAYDELRELTASHPDTYYYVDVYSTVSFTEKIFEERTDGSNRQLMGGWMSRSPLDKEKQDRFRDAKAYMAVYVRDGWNMVPVVREDDRDAFLPERDGYIRASEITYDGSMEYCEDSYNFYPSLSVPTYVYKVGTDYMIVDSYNNQIIYSEDIEAPLSEWKIMASDISKGHSIASDGEVFLYDDTENNCVRVCEKAETAEGHCYITTQRLDNIGIRPHYILYDESSRSFLCWSSESGEMYIFKRDERDNRIYLVRVKTVSALKDIYVRSFSMIDDEIYFVSGIGHPYITVVDKDSFLVRREIPVMDRLTGMIQISRIGKYYYLTVSTDAAGSQEAATIIRTKDLERLIKGDYEDIYSNFIGGGTPYCINEIDGIYYLTEHRIPGHSIWSFEIKNDKIRNIKAIQ